MAYLESSVVVYLRGIYYPEGFDFPLKEGDLRTLVIELGRELAALVMLGTVARVSAMTGWGRFVWFAYLFGAWDIWYYIWLKVFLDWPASLFTWDVLFLVPIVWIGPVLAPVLVSLLLIGGSIRAFQVLGRDGQILVDRWDWIISIAGSMVILYTFMIDMALVSLRGGVEAVTSFVPDRFNWPVFLIGLVIMAAAAVRIDRRSRGVGVLG